MALNEYQIVHAINDFVVGCKADGVWDKITEAYLMAGVNFGGITVKLKSVPDEVVYTSDFSAGTDGFTALNATLAGNIDADADGAGVPPSDNWLRVTSIGRNQFVGSTPLAPLRLNTSTDTFTLSVQVYLPAGHEYIGDAVAIKMRLLGGTNQEVIPNETPVQGLQTITYTIPLNGTSHTSVFIGGGATVPAGQVAYYKDFQLRNTTYSRLTNNNFVSGDYQATGSGAGLTGDGSTKYLGTGYNPSSLGVDDCHMGIYNTVAQTAGNKVPFGSYQGGTTSFFVRTTQYGDSSDFSLTRLDGGYNGNRVGYTLGTRESTNKVGYIDGVSTATLNATAGTIPNKDIYIGAINISGASNYSDATLTFAHIGTGLTDTDASNLSNRVNTLMTALGCNVY
jgi:hypothetical protein